MGAHFPAVELDNAIRFSILSRMSGFLWHSSKWACRFGRFLQYTSGLEVLACSLDTNINYVTAMLQLRLSLNHLVQLWQLLGESCGNFLGGNFLGPTQCVNSLDEIPNIPSWFSFGFGLFVLLYIWLLCYLLDY